MRPRAAAWARALRRALDAMAQAQARISLAIYWSCSDLFPDVVLTRVHKGGAMVGLFPEGGLTTLRGVDQVGCSPGPEDPSGGARNNGHEEGHHGFPEAHTLGKRRHAFPPASGMPPGSKNNTL